MTTEEQTAVPSDAAAAVFQQSEPVSSDAIAVKGPDFDEQLSLQALLSTYQRIGFQATSLGRAIDVVNKMVGPLFRCFAYPEMRLAKLAAV